MAAARLVAMHVFTHDGLKGRDRGARCGHWQ